MTRAGAGHLAMLCFSLMVAGSFSLGGLAANDIDPGALTAVRFWIASVVVGAVVLATRRPEDGAAVTALWRYVLLGGIFSIYFVTMFEGLKTTPPVSSAAVFTLTPAMSAVFGWILLRQGVTWRIVLALGIGAVGAVWVIFRADVAALLRFEIGRGELIFLGGCVAHAIYTPLIRVLNRGERPLVFTLGTLIAGALCLTVWAAPALWAVQWAALPAIVWITIAYVSIIASAGTFTLVQFATLRLPSSKVMAYTYLTPSWVMIWEIALGGALPPLMIVMGVMLTAGALLLLLREE